MPTDPHRTTTRATLALLAALPIALGAATAQSAPPAAPTSAPLLLPAGLHYRYWPLQVVQFIGPELPYDTIVLDIDDRSAADPSYDVTLTTRAEHGPGKRIHYVNQPALVAEDKAKGDEVHLTRIQFDHPAEPAKQAQYLLRFSTETGVPVLWQFVQGTDLSEQGSGLSPIDAPIPIFMYREQGALAAEGTALKIGDITSTADVWKEYAQPPYFVPYHGAISQGVHILSIAPGPTAWTDPQPAALAEGSAWQLTASTGLTLAAHADSVKNGAAVVSLADTGRGSVFTLEGQSSPSGWTISRVRFGPSGAKPEHTLSLVFSPPLGQSGDSHFDLLAGKKSKLAAGTTSASPTTAGPTTAGPTTAGPTTAVPTTAGSTTVGPTTDTWGLASPNWAKGKTAAATNTLTQ